MNRAELLRTLGLMQSRANHMAAPEDIRRAFRSWSKRNHPDAGGNADEFAKVATAVERYTRKEGAITKGCFVRYEGRFCEVVGMRGPRWLEVKHENQVKVIARHLAETPILPVNRACVQTSKAYALVPADEFYGIIPERRKTTKHLEPELA